MSEGCVDCKGRPRLHDFGSCFSETFALRAPSGAALQLTLRLCLRCGARFPDRSQLRQYLRTKLPAHALQAVPATAR
jgi:ribosomal protein L40E